MASPGVMESGLSRELFEMWCTDSKNGVIIAGKIKMNNLSYYSKFFIYYNYFRLRGTRNAS